MGSGAWIRWCGERKGARAPLPSLHREKSLEKAVDSGRSEGSRNEGVEAARASGRGRHGVREHMLRSTESPPSHMGAMCSPVGVDKGEGEWAGVSLWRSQGHNREKATQCSWFGIGSSGGGGMRSGAAMMSACVGGASGARRPPAFCGAGCGERREARAPPRPPPRDDHAGGGVI